MSFDLPTPLCVGPRSRHVPKSLDTACTFRSPFGSGLAPTLWRSALPDGRIRSLQSVHQDDDQGLYVRPAALEQYEAALEPHLHKWDEINAMRKELEGHRLYPDGDVSRIGLDEPIFGLHNWPDLYQYLYHYTDARTLTENPRVVFSLISSTGKDERSARSGIFARVPNRSHGPSGIVTPA